MVREADFAALLHLVERLSLEQRAALGRALAAAAGESEAIRLLEEAFLAAPRCPHCAATALHRWGYASGLRRYRCTARRKTFNALTGTSLARLRKRKCWLAYSEALAAGMTLVRAAAHCGVHMTTSFRGQGADLLEKLGWDGWPERVMVASYSAPRSLRTAAIWRSSNSPKRRPRQRSAARISAANISLRTAFSPKPLGMIFSRRRSSTNRRSRRFVVRVARRCGTGRRRWAMQASKSSSKQATALGTVAA